EGRRVDAVPQPRGMRPVGEDVPEVAAAARAQNLGAHHPVARVGLLVDRALAGRGVEGRPAATGVGLRVGVEQLGPAAGAAVRAGLEHVVVLAGERRLGALFAEDPVALGIELRAPLGLGLANLRQGSPFVVRPGRSRPSPYDNEASAGFGPAVSAANQAW